MSIRVYCPKWFKKDYCVVFSIVQFVLKNTNIYRLHKLCLEDWVCQSSHKLSEILGCAFSEKVQGEHLGLSEETQGKRSVGKCRFHNRRCKEQLPNQWRFWHWMMGDITNISIHLHAALKSFFSPLLLILPKSKLSLQQRTCNSLMQIESLVFVATELFHLFISGAQSVHVSLSRSGVRLRKSVPVSLSPGDNKCGVCLW